MDQRNSNLRRSLTHLYLAPLRLYIGTDRIPSLSSRTGRQVWPANWVFPDASSSQTSSRSRASSGTVSGNSNISSHEGIQLLSIDFVFFFFVSASTPLIAICVQMYFCINMCRVSRKCVLLRSLPLHKNLEESKYQSVCGRNHSTILRPYILSPVWDASKRDNDESFSNIILHPS